MKPSKASTSNARKQSRKKSSSRSKGPKLPKSGLKKPIQQSKLSVLLERLEGYINEFQRIELRIKKGNSTLISDLFDAVVGKDGLSKEFLSIISLQSSIITQLLSNYEGVRTSLSMLQEIIERSFRSNTGSTFNISIDNMHSNYTVNNNIITPSFATRSTEKKETNKLSEEIKMLEKKTLLFAEKFDDLDYDLPFFNKHGLDFSQDSKEALSKDSLNNSKGSISIPDKLKKKIRREAAGSRKLKERRKQKIGNLLKKPYQAISNEKIGFSSAEV